MNTGTFMDLISIHYKDIKNLFKSRSYNRNIDFDEDSFNDAFIKCAQRFGNEINNYDNAKMYYDSIVNIPTYTFHEYSIIDKYIAAIKEYEKKYGY